MLEKLKNPKLYVPLAAGTLIFIALVAFMFINKETEPATTNNSTDQASSQTSNPTETETMTASEEISWSFNGESWSSSSTPPECSSPLLTDLPVDITKVTNILYPGQTRGGDYKPHGGFRFAETTNEIKVTAPLDSQLVSASRYIQSGEIQYFFTFTTSCGLAYRFDHLETLTETFQKVVNTLPEAKVDDSRSTVLNPPVKVAKGEIVATAIGFKNSKNVFVDFGVYDLRSPNAASKDAGFAQKHADEKEFGFYGICWLEAYPTTLSTQLKALPGSGTEGKISDYCK